MANGLTGGYTRSESIGNSIRLAHCIGYRSFHTLIITIILMMAMMMMMTIISIIIIIIIIMTMIITMWPLQCIHCNNIVNLIILNGIKIAFRYI